jgi:hypothetical protein
MKKLNRNAKNEAYYTPSVERYYKPLTEFAKLWE